MLEVVVEGAVGDVAGECGAGFLWRVSLYVSNGGLGSVPDVLGRVVVGDVGRQIGRPNAFQRLSGPVQVDHGLGAVESCVVQDNGDLVVVRLPYQT